MAFTRSGRMDAHSNQPISLFRLEANSLGCGVANGICSVSDYPLRTLPLKQSPFRLSILWLLTDACRWLALDIHHDSVRGNRRRRQHSAVGGRAHHQGAIAPSSHE
jgi:hypothetical protein